MSSSPTLPNSGERGAHASSHSLAERNDTTENQVLPSHPRRWFLLFLFAMAQFMDIYSASAVIVGIPKIAHDLNMSLGESIWLINAYALTLSSFLLAAGRIADIWKPKWVFVIGFSWIGIFSLGIGFIVDKKVMFGIRALSGIGASLTIPSAMRLIVHLFPDPEEQAKAIAMFGGSGAVGNIVGLVLGGALLLADWTWIFWFVAIVSIPLAVISAILIPSIAVTKIIDVTSGKLTERKPKMDYIGTFLLTAGLVLLTYGLVDGSSKGWKRPDPLATLIIGFLLLPAFFYSQTRLDPHDALIIPNTWSIPNFTLITLIALIPNFWFYAVEVSFATIFQNEWGISPLLTAVRFIPVGGFCMIGIMACTATPLHVFPLRWRFVAGGVLAAGASILMAFVRVKSDFWRLVFPAFVIGSIGTGAVFISSNVALIMSVDPAHSGVAGGVFNTVVQLGNTLGLSITTSIQTAFPVSGTQVSSYEGYRATFFFLMAVMICVSLAALTLFTEPVLPPSNAPGTEKTSTEHGHDGTTASSVEEKRAGL